VTQVSVPDLRNANRFVTRYFSGFNRDKLEIVLNRHVTRNVEIDEAAVAKALTQPAKWKLPNDYAAVRRAQNIGVAVAMDKSPLAQALTRMAHAVSGRVPGKREKRKFGLF
jgi:pilus assembly protein CpaE